MNRRGKKKRKKKKKRRRRSLSLTSGSKIDACGGGKWMGWMGRGGGRGSQKKTRAMNGSHFLEIATDKDRSM